MKKSIFWVIILCLSVVGLTVSGCGKQSMGNGSFLNSGLTSGSLAIPDKLKPAPTIEITSPARGTYFNFSDTTVTVTGTVNEPKYTLTSLRVSGQQLAIPTDGKFSVQVNLEPGMNILWAAAKNSEGGRSLSAIAVMRGDYKPDTQLITNAAIIQIGSTGLSKVEKAVKPMLTTIDFETMLKGFNPLFQTSVPLVGSGQLTLESLKYNNPDIKITLGQGYLNVAISINNFYLSVRAQGSLLFGLVHPNIPVKIGATKVNASTKAYLSVVNGKLSVSFQNTNLVLEGYYFTFQKNPFINWLAGLARGYIKNKIISKVKKLLDDKVPPMLTNVFSNLKTPIKQTLLGKELNITLSPQTANVTSSRILMEMDSNVTVTNPPAGLAAPGSFYTPSLPPSLALNNADFVASLNDDLLNRILFTTWKSGLLNMTIDDAFFKQMNIASPIALNGALLLKFYPTLATHINDTDPLSIKITAHMAPIIQMVGSPDLAQISVGELGLDFIIHQGALARSALKVRVHIKMSASASVAGGKLKIQFLGQPLLLGDVTEEPMKDIDENKVELLLGVVVPVIMPQLTKSIQDIPLPTLLGLSLDQLNLQQDGPSGDYLTASGSLKVQ